MVFFEQLISSAGLAVWVLSGVMLMAFLIQLIYYLGTFSKIHRHRHPELSGRMHGISVIICARNEAENLRKNLPAFLDQVYPDYEVVVVNDCSTDDSDEVLMTLKLTYPNLHVTSIQEDRKFTHGKKLAVTVGIKAAKFDHMLFSDADCYPASKNWIKLMSRHFSSNKELILGIGKYERKKGLLNLLVRYETFMTAMTYISFAIKGHAYMGVGRNMGYRKDLFYKHKGFASHLKVLSGDDDLFVNEASTRQNTTVEISTDSFTYSTPPDTFRKWFRQKRRHLTTGKYYKASSKFSLGAELMSRMLFYGTFIALLTFDYWKYVALGAFFLLVINKLIVIKMNMKRLDERDLLLPSLLLDPLMPLLLGIIRIANIFRPREPKWN